MNYKGLIKEIIDKKESAPVYYKELSKSELLLFLREISVPDDIIISYLNLDINGRRRKRKVRT